MLHKPKLLSAFFLISFLMSSAISPSSLAQGENSQAKAWAVVIGISKYPKLPEQQQLLFADKDARDFAASIKSAVGDNLRLLINQQATAEAIKEAIGDWLARSVVESDTVYIYFSGHGIAETEYGEAYLLAYDSDAKLPYSSGVSLRELSYAISRRVKASRILIMADAVRRDFFDSEIVGDTPSKTFTTAFNQLSQWRAGISTLLSTSFGEYSREGQKWNSHGAFTDSLIETITNGPAGKANGILNAEDVFNALAVRIPKETSKKQHPMKTGASLAQFEITRKSTVIASAPSPAAEPNPSTTQVAAPAQIPANQPQNEKVIEPIRPSSPSETLKPTKINGVDAGSSKLHQKPENKSVVVEGARKPQQPVNINQPEQANAVRPESARTNQPSAKPGDTSPKTGAPSVAVNKADPAKTIQPRSNKAEPANSPSSLPKNDVTTVASQPKSVSKSLPASKAVQPTTLNTESKPNATNGLKPEEITPPSPPVKSQPTPPAVASVSASHVNTATESTTTSIPANVSTPAPAPLLLDFEAAIKAGRLVEPKGFNAWEYYQQMTQQPAMSAEAAHLKPRLAESLLAAAKGILVGDVRSDNISDKVEEFKRAGLMLAKAKSVAPEKTEISALEKLSAAQALVSLQFYDEAEKALLLLPKTAATENALGIVYAGKLDNWKAERAFKNACEMEPAFASSHYNLGLLYRAQKNEAALAEFEKAAEIDTNNYAAFLAVGDDYFAKNQWQQAAEAYRKAVAARPFDDTLHTKLGHALYSQGLRDEANKEYQKAKELRSKQ
jgi:tetratricopeptide (TPR) repeat protein